MTEPPALGHYIRMIEKASRIGGRLVPLRDIRLLDDDEQKLCERLAFIRGAGLSTLSVEECVRWAALLLYSFGRQTAAGGVDLRLFGEQLSSQELAVLAPGHELWVRIGVAGSERELVALRAACTLAPRPSSAPASPRSSIAIGRQTSIDRLLRGIIQSSPSWKPGRSLRRLVVSASDEIEFERVLGTWLWRDINESPMTLGAVFILYGSRVFARGGPYSYRTLERRLGVATIEERVAMRYRAIEKGAEAYFGVHLSGGPASYIEQMLLHSGGGWEYVAEAVEKLAGKFSVEPPPSWTDVQEALMLLPKQAAISGGLREIVHDPPIREFINRAIRLVGAACRERASDARTPEWLGELLDIASEDARKRLAAAITTRRPVMAAPATTTLALHLRNASGEMPRVVVALPHSLEWPEYLPPSVERFRLFVAGESKNRPIVYAKESGRALRQGPVEILELPIDAQMPLEVMLESDQGAQLVFERLILPDIVTVFSLETGKLAATIPSSGEIALVTRPGFTVDGNWGRDLPSRSGVTVRVGEIPATAISLSVRGSEGFEDSFELRPARSVAVVSVDGFLDDIGFGRSGRIAVRPPRVHAIRADLMGARVAVERGSARTAFTVAEGEKASVPGVAAPGLYRIHPPSPGRARAFIYAPEATFTVRCTGAQAVLEAQWRSDEPARIEIDGEAALGSLTLALRRDETFAVNISPPTFARDAGAVRWLVSVHPRRFDVADAPGGEDLENPIFERIRFGGGLRVFGNPREDVAIKGFYRQRTLRLDARGRGFFPFAHLDEDDLDEELGRSQLFLEVEWRNPYHRVSRRIAREASLRTDARAFSPKEGEAFLDVQVPNGIEAPVIEALPLWKPWDGWARLPPVDVRLEGCTGTAVHAPDAPGPYLVSVSDGADPERRLRGIPGTTFVEAPSMERPIDALEQLLWDRNAGGDTNDLLAAFDARLARDGDDFLDGLLSLFQRSGLRLFTVGQIFWRAIGARRLIARANHACGRATAVELRLLAVCEQERVPWSALRKTDVARFVAAIDSWDEGAHALAIEAACSARAGVGFWLHQALPDERSASIAPQLPRLLSAWAGTTALDLQERERVVTEQETLPDEIRSPRVATLYDARQRLGAGHIRVERLRPFTSEEQADQRMPADLMELDSALRGLAGRVTRERTIASLSRETFRGAQYAERAVPRLYEYWLEAMAAKNHGTEG